MLVELGCYWDREISGRVVVGGGISGDVGVGRYGFRC